MTIPTTTESAPSIPAVQEASFDITKAQIPSFGALQQARAQVFSTRKSKDAFAREVLAMSSAGEEGRRKGLGLWMIGDYAAAAEQLQQYASERRRGRALEGLPCCGPKPVDHRQQQGRGLEPAHGARAPAPPDLARVMRSLGRASAPRPCTALTRSPHAIDARCDRAHAIKASMVGRRRSSSSHCSALRRVSASWLNAASSDRRALSSTG